MVLLLTTFLSQKPLNYQHITSIKPEILNATHQKAAKEFALRSKQEKENVVQMHETVIKAFPEKRMAALIDTMSIAPVDQLIFCASLDEHLNQPLGTSYGDYLLRAKIERDEIKQLLQKVTQPT